MDKHSFSTLSEAVNTLTSEGYKEDFEARDNSIIALYSKKEFQPGELNIVANYRFDGNTNPSDDATVFAIEASDGTKGTLVMSYSAEHAQNVDLIRQIPNAKV
ncbi:phosphoribosylpyrophosphate synthetase [Flagellimonas sp. GZD32]|uniref:phosphoribosylpyrophosphate synthetase n=1 Tax=Flagellimonas cixiensis TaxID=3228750 RepID=UPI0035C91C37